MNKQKEFAKISVLIDKLNYLNDNLDYNNFNPNNVDFLLLKKYVDEIQLKLQQIGNQNVNVNQFVAPVETKIDRESIIEEEKSVAHQNEESVEFNSELNTPNIEKEEPIEIDNFETVENEPLNNDFELSKEIVTSEPEEEVFVAENRETEEKSELYDLYDINESGSNKLTKVSDIVNNIDAKDGQKENIQQDIIETINAIKGGNNVSAIADNTKTNFTPKPIENLDSIIVNTKEEVKEEITELKEKPVTEINGISLYSVESENEDLDLNGEDGKQSLNDLFKGEHKNVADKVTETSVKRNLKDIIDINDRFQFIQSLFGGSYLGFEEAVGTVSKQANYSEALDYIDQKLKSTYNWDSDSKVVDKFLTLVEKCYQA